MPVVLQHAGHVAEVGGVLHQVAQVVLGHDVEVGLQGQRPQHEARHPPCPRSAEIVTQLAEVTASPQQLRGAVDSCLPGWARFLGASWSCWIIMLMQGGSWRILQGELQGQNFAYFWNSEQINSVLVLFKIKTSTKVNI